MRFFTLLGRALRLRCALCGQGRLFRGWLAMHPKCANCGVKSFYRPRSNPDGWSVNARCLDSTEGLDLIIEAFDGQNWDANAASLSHLSKEPA